MYKRQEDAEKFIELGADRLGTSRIVKIVKNEKDVYKRQAVYGIVSLSISIAFLFLKV